MRFKRSDIDQVRSNAMSREAWVEVRKKKNDLSCPECKIEYTAMTSKTIGIIARNGKLNQHICNDCCKLYSEKYGIEDLYIKFNNEKKRREELVREIMVHPMNTFSKKSLDSINDDNILTAKLDALKKRQERKDYLESIDTTGWAIDDYLVKQHGVIIDTKWLKDVSQINGYFEDKIDELFECGQGYYQDKAEAIVFINHKFYRVKIKAEICSSKQDRGDKLYWVEKIESVMYHEIPKPEEKKKSTYHYDFSVDLLEEEREALDEVLLKYGVASDSKLTDI